MTSTTLRLLALAFLAAANGLVVGGIDQRSAVSRPVQPRLPVPAMVSDKEFEEWARKKRIASGVDPDEDFGAGRRAESHIYVVGGATPARHRLPCSPVVAETQYCARLAQARSPSLCPPSLPSGPTTRAI